MHVNLTMNTTYIQFYYLLTHTLLYFLQVIALWQGGDIAEFKNITKFLETRVTYDHTLTITMSAEEALSLEPNEVVVCSKQYEIPEISLSQISLCSIGGELVSQLLY